MDLTAWFGSQGVFSTGEAAHIFGSGSVPQFVLLGTRRVKSLERSQGQVNGTWAELRQ
jgi:hypothetical protein